MMHRTGPAAQEAPWYRQAGFWWLMTPPLAAVVGGVITLMVAIDHPDQLLPGDPTGSAIPQALIQEAQAHSKNITATLQQRSGQLQITLQEHHDRPAALHLQLQPWGRRDGFQHITLYPDASGIYHSTLPASVTASIQGGWYGELSPEDGKWLLTGPVTLHGAGQAVILGESQPRR
jgi:hypothetical protein